MPKLLFILKRREDFNASIHNTKGLSTGLFNSATFVSDMLNQQGFEAELAIVTDNNDIDREVTNYKPTHVIIEALWVVPSKFPILQKLHPNITWIIRFHSEMPFMAGEGIAMDWMGDYSTLKNVLIACNSPRMLREVRTYLTIKHSWSSEICNSKVIYLPNYYPQIYKTKVIDQDKDTINIGCFGAIRPLKNHLLQALSAIEFANSIGKKLQFHINAGRIEMNGEPMVNNLKGLFQQLYDKGHSLINNQWMPHEEFLALCANMDIGMQVSFSETFNIVGADFISQGVPIVGSKEIPWMIDKYCAYPTSSIDIIKKLNLIWDDPTSNVLSNKDTLTKYTNDSQNAWITYFKGVMV